MPKLNNTMKPVLPYLEMMANQSCNLACHGCTNYSDLRHSGYVTWAQGKEQISNWITRIDIPDFGIIDEYIGKGAN